MPISPPVVREDGVIDLPTEDGGMLHFIEYRRRNNRGPLPMQVWFRQAGLTADRSDLSGWEHRLYRPYRTY